MNILRRKVLKSACGTSVLGVAVAAGLLQPLAAFAGWNKVGFESRDIGAAMGSIGASGAVASSDITVKAPDIAENGAVVPVEITSNLPGIESITLIGEKNTLPLIAVFNLSNGAQGYVSTRIKMGSTSNVIAVIKGGGKVYKAHKEVKVTIGGCGG
jgi:sulfur-oxidizing protein SoxY